MADAYRNFSKNLQGEHLMMTKTAIQPEIRLASTEADMLACWDVLHALRPHLVEADYLQTMREMMAGGYHLAYVWVEGKAMAAVGYRFQQFLYNGKHIYIDDLSTLPEARGLGYGGLLLDYVEDVAREKGLKIVTLDSGFQRLDAHRLYLNKRYTIASMHFSKQL
jgi:GNAT superfamily N-acetyltransferase